MKRYTVYVSVVLLIVVLSGCGAAARTIAARSTSERSDVFTEVVGNEAAPSGYTDVLITASIKTHLEGYYPGESKELRARQGGLSISDQYRRTGGSLEGRGEAA